MEDVQINGNFKFQTIDFIIIAYIYSHEIKNMKYEKLIPIVDHI